jgi:uncharacterized protein with ParB-like and HNH nuclease domain
MQAGSTVNMDIIDGQQRLITIHILLAKLAELGNDNYKEYVQQKPYSRAHQSQRSPIYHLKTFHIKWLSMNTFRNLVD